MKKTTIVLSVCGLLLGIGWLRPSRAATNDVELRPTTEVIGLLKSHYVDHDKLDQKLLNDATVSGILQALGRGAQILSADEVESNATTAVQTNVVASEPLARAEIIEPNIGYIRLTDLAEKTVAALDAELKKFSDAKTAGYILDLRFADGTNYAVAAEVASRFVAANQELFTLKQSVGASQTFRSAEAPRVVASDSGEAPLMVLINARTRGSAEALAGALRAQERGILVGGKTEGSAVAWQDMKLDDGRVLRVATAKIELPKGGEVFPAGVTPDIPVKIDPKIEKDAVLNPPTNVTLTASLQPRQARKALSEADLVKAFRGEAIEMKTPVNTNAVKKLEEPDTVRPPAVEGEKAPEEEGEIQKVRDVVLQRAVDILKGIRVLLSSR